MHTCRFWAAIALLAAVAAAGSVDPAWIKHYTGPTQSQFNEAADSYLDTLTGNVYVVGSGELPSNAGAVDLLVMKYRPDGTRAWVNGFSGGSSSPDNMAQAVAVDSVGNVYIAGVVGYGVGQPGDAAWAKYDSNGTELWHRASGWSKDDIAYDITIDKSGGVYICGSDSGYGVLTGYMVARINPANGDTLWKRSYVLDTNALTHRNPGPDLHPDYFEDYDFYDNNAVSIAASPDSGVVTTGQGSDSNRGLEWWTMRFRPNGDTMWTRTYHNPNTVYDDAAVAFDLAVAKDGDIYAVGFDYYERSNSQGYNFAVVRYSSAGTRDTWRSIDVASEHGDDYAYSVALDDSTPQNVYVTGTLEYPAPLLHQVATMKFDNTLTSRWGASGSTYGTNSDDDYGYSVCYRKGRVYVTGQSAADLFVLGYTAANASPKDTLWTYRYDGPDHLVDFGVTICAKDSDHVYASGESNRHGTSSWSDIYTARLRYGHPDMGVSAILAPQGTYDHWDTVIPRAAITNYGDIIPMFNAFMYIGLPYGDTVHVYDGPEPGHTDTVAFKPWPAHPTGLVTVRCSLETDGDTNPNNDFLTETVQVRPIDVGCRRILSPVGTIDSGTVVMPAARYKNYGTSSQTFPIWFRIETAGVTGAVQGNSVATAGRLEAALPGCLMKNGVASRVSSVSSSQPPHQGIAGPPLQAYQDSAIITLAPQESVDHSFKTWQTSPPGTFQMKAFTALYGDDVPTNDTASAQLIVRQPRHDVGVTAILAPADTVDSGAVLVPRAVISNFGGARESFRIRFTVGTFFTSETVMTLPVGGSDTAEFAPWTANQVGTHAARCSTMLASDTNHANDFVQRQMVVKPAPGIESPENISGIPREYSLGSPRPNPFVGSMLVPFALPARSQVSLRIYDAAGGLVRTLASAELPAGFYHAVWNGTDERGRRVERGAYFCRLLTTNYCRIAKLIVSD